MRARTESAVLATPAPAAAKLSTTVLPSTRRRGAIPRTLFAPSRCEWTKALCEKAKALSLVRHALFATRGPR
eukprot:9291646-Pyramimonas_sp.AAC.1